MFARIRRDVGFATNASQQPASFSSLTDPFYFIPDPATPTNDIGEFSPPSAIPAVPIIEASDRAVYDPIQRGVPIAGRVVGEGPVTITIDGDKAVVGANGEFSYLMTGLARGEERPVTVKAVDQAGYEVKKTMVLSRTIDRPPPAEPPLDPRNLRGRVQLDAVALVIGVETYRNTSLPVARFAAADAQRFADYAEWGLGVPADRIALLTDNRATSGAVLAEIRGTLMRAQQEGPIGAVYVFFSGHGLDIDGEPHLLAYDYDQFAAELTTISTSELVDWVEANDPKSITLFVDACFSGSARDGGTVLADAKGLRAGTGFTNPLDDRVAVLTGASNAGLSMSLPGIGQGAFSYVLMRGLEGEADANGDRAITLAELEEWTARELPKLSRTPSGQQRPSYNGVDRTRVLEYLN